MERGWVLFPSGPKCGALARIVLWTCGKSTQTKWCRDIGGRVSVGLFGYLELRSLFRSLLAFVGHPFEASGRGQGTVRFRSHGRARPECMRFDIASCCLDAGRVVGPQIVLPQVSDCSHRP